ncbi:MAG: hypothetical protein OQK49_06835 [Proteobacteria bacterium]|nr:hypothetical protein [Pseudomonadota bacterium]
MNEKYNRYNYSLLMLIPFVAKSSKACIYEYDEYVVPKTVFNIKGAVKLSKLEQEGFDVSNKSDRVRVTTEQETCSNSFEELMDYVGLRQNDKGSNSTDLCSNVGCTVNFQKLNVFKVILNYCQLKSHVRMVLEQTTDGHYNVIKSNKVNINQCPVNYGDEF